MTLLLGIDTGGTYTDAVIHDETAPAPGILGKAKALTTHDDLSIGIGNAIGAVLAQDFAPSRIALASISTTLATNALVEGKGGDICLVLIGFDGGALQRAGLADAMKGNPVAMIAGGHSAAGARQAPLDTAALRAAIEAHAGTVEAFAVVAHFGSRDPVDEIAARALIRDATNLPVTCGHELSAQLNGPRRALTALLNARLIGLIDGLITATQQILSDRGIEAPLMIVRGDGSLVSAAFARDRPIETILSGPAASLVGAAHLTGRRDAVVSDIGGTTTDIALLHDGRPTLSPDGAQVGGHRTMVEAVAMTTCGLGGDSSVTVDETSMAPRIVLGPRRVLPIARLAAEHPNVVCPALEAQLARPTPGPHDARFLFRTARAARGDGLRQNDHKLLGLISEVPVTAAAVLRSQMDLSALSRLVERGLVMIAGFTPTDAAHVLGDHLAWDADAAHQAARLIARKRTAGGTPVATSPHGLAAMVRDALVRRSAEEIFDAVIAGDEIATTPAARNPLVQAALDGHRGAVRVDLGLALPLVGLGASAALYYPAVAQMLGALPDICEAADVANAVGAVAGRIRVVSKATLTQPVEGLIRAHLPGRVEDFTNRAAARTAVLAALRDHARQSAAMAGADNAELSEDWQEKTAMVENHEIFVEATATVTASGRPRLAREA